MTEDRIDRKEILARIRQGIKQAKLNAEVQTWADIADDSIEVIPTPSARLNNALGVGGFPTGRVVEVYGTEGSGKTTLALHMLAAAQAQDKVAAFIDMEHSLSPSYAKALGINMDDLLVSQPMCGDDAMELCKVLIENGCGAVVIDSVPALVSRDELEKGITEHNMAMQARMLSQGLRQLTPFVNQSNTVLMFVNQIREKIGVMFGNPETTPGGRALKFYSSVRLRLSTIGQPKKDKEGNAISGVTKIRVVKNKVAPPYKECLVSIEYGKGIDTIADTLGYAKEQGVVKTAGPYYIFEPDGDEVRKIQGEAKAIEFLRDNPEIEEHLRRTLSGETTSRHDSDEVHVANRVDV